MRMSARVAVDMKPYLVFWDEQSTELWYALVNIYFVCCYRQYCYPVGITISRSRELLLRHAPNVGRLGVTSVTPGFMPD